MKERILEDLNKTGFISELYIAQNIANKGWKPTLSSSFFDKDLNISREIDIIATKKAISVDDKLSLWVNLVIEVKKSSKPWIIFTNELEKKGVFYNGMPGWTLIHGGENYIGDRGGVFSPEDIHEHLMRIDKKRIGKAFHEAFKPPTETSKIFQAIISACKAAIDKSEVYPEENSYRKKSVNTDKIYLEFYHPMIVIDGPLFEVYLDDKNAIKLEEQDWIPVNYEYSSNNYGSEYGRSVTFYPDIVKYEAIDQYIDLVDKWLATMMINFSKRIG